MEKVCCSKENLRITLDKSKIRVRKMIIIIITSMSVMRMKMLKNCQRPMEHTLL